MTNDPLSQLVAEDQVMDPLAALVQYDSLGPAEKQDIQKRWDEARIQQMIRERNLRETGEFSRGLKRGIDQTQATLYGATALAGDAVGLEGVRDWGFEGYKRNQEEASMNPASVSDIRDIDSVGSAADWFMGTLGELTPSVAEAFVSAIAGGGVAGLAGRTVAKEAIEKAVQKQITKGVAREIAESQVKKKLFDIGTKAGITLGVGAMEGGGMYGEDADKRGIENANPWSAGGLGLVSGASEVFAPEGKIIRKLLGLAPLNPVDDIAKKITKKEAAGLVRQAGAAIPKSMVGEAGQETFQEVINVLNEFINDPEVDMLSTENLWRYANAGAMGAAGGVLFGGADAVIPGKKEGTDQQIPQQEGYTPETPTAGPAFADPTRRGLDPNKFSNLGKIGEWVNEDLAFQSYQPTTPPMQGLTYQKKLQQEGKSTQRATEEHLASTAYQGYQPAVPTPYLGAEKAYQTYNPPLPLELTPRGSQPEPEAVRPGESENKVVGGRPATYSPEALIDLLDQADIISRHPAKPIIRKEEGYQDADYVAGKEQKPKVELSRVYGSEVNARRALKTKTQSGQLKADDYDVFLVDGGWRIQSITTEERRARNQIPEKLRPAIAKMKQDLANGDIGGVTFNEHGEAKRYKSTNPDWFKLDTVKEYDKKHDTDFAAAVTKQTVLDAVARKERGEGLNAQQKKAWEYVLVQAQDLNNTDRELTIGQEVDEMEARGFDPVFEKKPAVEFDVGDEIITGGKDGIVPADTYKVKGRDEKGDVVLEDGMVVKVDDFDLLDVEGVKKGNGGTSSELETKASVENSASKTAESETQSVLPLTDETQTGLLVAGDTGGQLDQKANEAATSPQNDLPEPTEAMKQAGNYKLGHVSLHGFDVSIENPKGSARSGTDKSGKSWSITMKNHYGYFRGTQGKDKDHIDVFLTDNAENAGRPVFVVDQVDPGTKKFDEHKVIMGAANEQEAREAYLANYEKGWQGLGAITEMSLDEFKEWTGGDTTKPIGLEETLISVKSLVEARTKKEIDLQLDRLFGTLDELDAMEDPQGLDIPFSEALPKGILGVATDYRADLRRAAIERDYEETEEILRAIESDDDLPADKRRIIYLGREPAGVRDVHPAPGVSDHADTGGKGEEREGSVEKPQMPGVAHLEVPPATSASEPENTSKLKRRKPKNTIVFSKPIIGKTGAKVHSYTWAWKEGHRFDKREGADVETRISDWDKAVENPETGKPIVHQFDIELPTGEQKTVSKETATSLLGLDDDLLLRVKHERNRSLLREAISARRALYAAFTNKEYFGRHGKYKLTWEDENARKIYDELKEIIGSKDPDHMTFGEYTDNDRSLAIWANKHADKVAQLIDEADLLSGRAASPETGQTDRQNETPKPENSFQHQVKQDDKTPSKIDDLGEKIGGARKDLFEKSAPRPARPIDKSPGWRKRYQVSEIASSNKPAEIGKWTIRDTRKKDWRGNSELATRELFNSKEEAERAVPLVAVSRNHLVRPDHDGTYRIYRRIGDRKVVIVVQNTFQNREEAMLYMAENAEAIIEAKTSFGEEILPAPDNVARKGEERRKGDVASQNFMDTFGFRAVEFGNWNNQAERQEVMNHAYDALLDLADVLGVPAKALSLNGELALAFGARGQGLTGAKAHYERDYGVINLTKMSGAGSLAHEWLHAFDHYLGRQDGKASGTKKANDRGDLVYEARGQAADYASHGFKRNESGVREELREAYRNLLETMFAKAEKYFEDTARADEWLGKSREGLQRELDSIRNNLATERDPKYWKRNNKPASAEQLAEFDALAERLTEGQDLDVRYQPNEKSRGGFGGRTTNDTLEAMSVILKAVRGRSGFNAEKTGTLDRIRSAMAIYAARIKMMKDAEGKTEKTRSIPTEFARDAKSIDQGRGSNYWSTPHEMAARAFSAYVNDKIAENGGQSDFLVYGTKFAVPTPWGFIRAYPAREERTAINKAFDKFVSVLKAKKTDKGVALYSKSSPPVVATLTGDEVVAGNEEDLFGAAREYFKNNLQGMDLHRSEIGAIRVTGKGWHKMKRGLKTDSLKIKLIPAIPQVIEQGQYHGREAVEDRKDDIVAFHYFDGFVDLAGKTVQVGATVAEDSFGNLFYNLNHDADKLWEKRKAHLLPRLEARGGEPSSEGDAPFKYSINTSSLPVNLVILDQKPSSGLSPAAVRITLENELGKGAIKNLVDKGNFEIVHSVADLPGEHPSNTKGLYQDGKTYLVADNLTQETAKGVMLHEVGVHYGLKRMLGAKFGEVIQQVKNLEQIRNKAVLEAKKRVPPDTPKAHFHEDIIGYLVEDPANHEMSVVRKIIAGIRSFLFRIGLIRNLSTDDIVTLAQGAAKRAGRDTTIKADEDGNDKPKYSRAYTPAQEEALDKIGPRTKVETAKEKLTGLRENLGIKLRQGVIDSYASLKDLDEHAWKLARLSHGASGSLEAAFVHGKLKLDEDGTIDVDTNGEGLAKILQPLGDELDDFLAWIAGNRAAHLKEEGREHLLSDEDIAALKNLNKGKMANDQLRELVYSKVHKEFKEFQKSILDIAEQTGIINPEERAVWSEDFYVPFYRLLDEDGEAKPKGPRKIGGLVNQTAYKKLKGANIQLNDLLSNVLLNWHHLLDASLKNQAAKRALTAAEAQGFATRIPEHEQTKKAVYYRENGMKVWVEVEEPLLLEAISALSWEGFNNPAMKAMRAFKRAFTLGITASPEFRIANLLRDTIHSVAVTPMNLNMVQNVIGGFQGTKKDSLTRARMLAGGGEMHFGHLYGGDPDAAKLLIKKGIKDDTILNNPKAFTRFGTAAKAVWDRWTEFGSRMENINRAALYDKLRGEGKSHFEASFEARDLMDFSQHGAWPAIRFLVQVVPFLNARIQGLDKMGRAVVDKKQRTQFSAVTGAVALASMALYLAFKDDDDFKEREEWDRDTYWWFKVPGADNVAFRIPKPFEVGAIGTLAERVLEQIVDDKAHGELFAERLRNMLTETFSFSVVPQMVQPALDVYSNRNPFTGNRIESMGMERLSPTERRKAWTSETAIALSKGMDKIAWDDVVFSPVQVEYLVKGYLGWIGSTTLAATDMIFMRPITGAPERPSMKASRYPAFGRFVRDLPADSSKYTSLFYDQLGEISTVYADLQQYKKLGESEKYLEKLEESRELLKWRKTYNKVQRQFSEINTRMKVIYADRQMSSEEKRREIDRLTQLKNHAARILTQKREVFDKAM